MPTSIQLGPFAISLENGKLVIDADSTEKQQEAEKRRETRLLKSVKKFFEDNGGFRKESEISRKYHLSGSANAKRMLAILGFKMFTVQSGGRPATYYVLLNSLDHFRQVASERRLVILDENDPNHPTSFK